MYVVRFVRCTQALLFVLCTSCRTDTATVVQRHDHLVQRDTGIIETNAYLDDEMLLFHTFISYPVAHHTFCDNSSTRKKHSKCRPKAGIKINKERQKTEKEAQCRNSFYL